ncbi:phospholipase D family protein (plasmid) [Burkholderia multivorans]|uniref:phospholipase D n=2 Tax=Burkholderia multivorans TaxID=87883 RepID=A0A0H3KZY0_BURM1|nr:phospholipase D family protein [Burkholderia multivorans]ELK7722862.1 phospholipase D family protein [Burkholderia cenocepacia]ABX19849.1 phosphatidylserine/phosphatidylglycerophosphate/cardiolipin synthase-like protein [Burkholderia multivorans ATCC 17616]MBR8048900.1 phospholipase D family protein [Burkholderia multivorans]MBR8453316.1 phospholipase D family protein [Burkholderia multivorans]MBU9451297.1 phospholipase D family protein [Burkholderia multivorans]
MTLKLLSWTAPAVIAGCIAELAIALAAFASPVASVATVLTTAAPEGRVTSYAFSPDGKGMDLVLYGVGSAHRSIHVLAYVMTYRPLIEALAAKARAGVPVAIAVDYGESIANDRDGYIRRGLDYLARAGAAICVVDRYRLMHDKAMILDHRSVQTGSINYTAAGAKSNSENVVIAWNDPVLAEAFEQHFRSRLAQCRPLDQVR